MNQEKIGKFIAKLRKDNKMTQQELADKLSVTDRAIGNWENGRRMPDVAFFKPLCEILGISFNELLAGESNNKDDNITIEAIKYYNGKAMRRRFIILSSIIIFAIVAFLSIYMINNYDKCKIYAIDTKNEEFFVNGYLMINQKNKILAINRLDYNFDSSNKFCGCDDCICPDILAEDMRIIVFKDEVILKEINRIDLNSESRYLADVIKNVTIDLNDLDEDNVRNWDSKGFRIVINYKVYKDNNVYDVNLDIDLELHEIYANNKIFY